MSLPRYEKIFRKADNSSITYVGTVYETDVEYNQVGATHCVVSDKADNDEYEYAIRGGGSNETYNAEPYDLEYYFGSEDWDLAEWHEKCGKSFSECLQYLLNHARDDNSESWKTVNSAEIPDLTSLNCGIMKSNTSEYWYIPNIRYTFRNQNKTITVMGQSITVRMTYVDAYLVIQYGTWDSTNNKWRNLSSSTVCDALQISFHTHIGAGMDTTINDLASSIAHKIYASIGPGSSISSHKYVSYSNNTTSYYFRARNVGEWDEPNLMWRSDSGIGNVGGNNWNDNGTVEPDDPWTEPDPYEPVPPGPTPPGPVNPTDPTDPVPEPDYPPIDGTSCGIYKVYKPTAGQLQDIASKLWDPTAWDAIKQMFTNPMDAIFGLAIVPVEPITSGSEDVYLGRYNTHVSCLRVDREYVTVDCGSVFISKFYGSYLDHDPYTKFTLYLPYIGELDINADEIMGKTVSVKYHCNVVTGDTVAIVLINNRSCYTAMGNIIRQLPLSQVDFSSVIQTAVSAAATMLQTAHSVSSGVMSAGVGSVFDNPTAALSGVQRATTAAINGISNTIEQVASAKLAYKHAGKIGQGAAQMSVQKPFFTVERPNISLPEGVDQASSSSQKRYTGYPANFVDELRNFHGFTIVEECQLNMLGATDAEIAEATSILKGGVIL